jgi:alkanesulfonate monooxygenase SsuD/methylene tetrahydromethanopterin reductase-like flavin-dependent oxidoreductase (luciferase family)
VLSFGVKTSQIGLTYAQILETWQTADAMPAFSHAWLWDHMVPLRGPVQAGALEAWTLLAALAAQTSRLRLGVIVTSNRLRSAPLLAKMAATVDVISGGRLDFGIGAGGSRVAGPNPAIREFEAYGIPLVSPGAAVRDLAETLQIIRRMWTEPEPFDFAGPTQTLRGAICEPKPIQKPLPPIMIGGSGERLLRIVAEHADIWNYPGAPDAEFRRRDAILVSHCEAIGRDPATITRSMQTIIRAGEPDAAAAARATLLDMIDAGVRHIVLAAVLAGRPLQWLVDEIVEPVRAEAGASST